MQVRELTNQEIQLVSRQMTELIDNNLNPHFAYLGKVNNYIAWKKQNRLLNLRVFEKRLGDIVENRLEEMAKVPGFDEQKFLGEFPALYQLINNIIQDFKSNLDQPNITSEDKLFLEYLNHIKSICHSLVIIANTKDKVINSAGSRFEIGADHLADALSAVCPAIYPPQLIYAFQQVDEWPVLPSAFEYLHTSIISIYMTLHANSKQEYDDNTKLIFDANSRIVQTYVEEFLLLCRDTVNNHALTSDEKSKIICDFVDKNINHYGDFYHAVLLKLSETYDFTSHLNIPEATAKQVQQLLSNFAQAQRSINESENKIEFAMKLMTDLINSDHWQSKSGRNIIPGTIGKLRNIVKKYKYIEFDPPEEKQRAIKTFCQTVNHIILESMNKKSLLRDEMTNEFYEYVSALTKPQDTTKATEAFIKLNEMHYQTIVQPREILLHLRQFLFAPEWQNITPGISKLQSLLYKSFVSGKLTQDPITVLRSLAKNSYLFMKPDSDLFTAHKENDIYTPLSRELHAKLRKLYKTPYDQAARNDLLDYISQKPAQTPQARFRGTISQ